MDTPTAYNAAKLGMWLFLATELLLFGVLFTAFAIFRWMYLDEFKAAAHNLDWRMGAINTVVLIGSSFTAALAVDAAQHGNNAKVRKLLLVTVGAAVVFLIVKYFEYSAKASHGIFPGNMNQALLFGAFMILFAFVLAKMFAALHYGESKKYYTLMGVSVLVVALYGIAAVSMYHLLPFEPPAGAHYQWGDPEFVSKYGMYYGLYYCMTGLHALHVIIGMGLLYWVYLLAKRDRFSPEYNTPVEVGALYWHLVDLIWIYLFPLLYLVE